MAAMGRIARTVELAKASWGVLKADKELLALPVISALASLAVAATFVIPIVASSGLEAGSDWSVLQFILLFVMYVALAYVTIFFNAALVHAADERLNGGDPTIGSAIRGAGRKAGAILPWAVVSATVTIILRAIEERVGLLGQIIVSIVGLAWSLVTFLVIPILVLENVSVSDAIKRSSSLFKETWGENMAAQFGFGIIGFLAALPAIALVVLGAGLGGAVLGMLIIVAVAWVLLVAVVLSALNGIFMAALYHYAASGEVPGRYFPNDAFSGAFAPRQRRRGGIF